MKLLQMNHVQKSFNNETLHVLKDISLSVEKGEVVAIIGPSGSGKSTLLRCINLLETPTNGKVLFHGSDITAKGSDPCAYRAKVGMVFQSFNLFNNMDVMRNLTVAPMRIKKMPKDEAESKAIQERLSQEA